LEEFIDRRTLTRAAAHLKKGGIVAAPTQGLFGLLADAFNERAVRRLFEIKGRPLDLPLLALVDGVDMAREVTSVWPEEAQRLAERFWPGPLTIVAPKAPSVPSVLVGGGDTIGVRCDAHPLARALVTEAGTPLAAPSANPHGEAPATTAEGARRAFSGVKDVLVVDAPPPPDGTPSTVVVVSVAPGASLRVVREGAVSSSALGL